MNKTDALKFIQQSRLEEWREIRQSFPRWKPDFKDSEVPMLNCVVPAYKSGYAYGIPPFPVKVEIPAPWDLTDADLRGAHLEYPAKSGYRWVDESKGLVVLYNQNVTDGQTFQFGVVPDFRGAVYDLNTTFWWTNILRKRGARLYVSVDEGVSANEQVFISYAWANEDVVTAIDAWLRHRRISTHIDKRDFFAGARIREEIVRVMSESSVILIFFSEQAKDRPWIEFERELAADLEMDAKQNGRTPPRIIYICVDAAEPPSVTDRQKIYSCCG